MVNRKDFRPSNDYSSSKKTYNPVKPKKDVVKAFIRGENAHTGNDSLTSDGKTLYSYNTAIAVRQSNGSVVVNNTKYSPTTSRQQSILMSELKDSNTKYDVTGGKERNYQGEDFSSEYDKKNEDNPYHSKDEQSNAYNENAEIEQEQSEHPQLSKKQAETIVKQHQKKDTYTRMSGGYEINDRTGKVRATSKYGSFGKLHDKEVKESLKRFANRKDKKQLTDYKEKKFSLKDSKGFDNAETYKSKLENEGYKVTTKRRGFDDVTIEGRKYQE